MKYLLLLIGLLYLLFLSGCSLMAMGGAGFMAESTQVQISLIQEKMISKERGILFDIIEEDPLPGMLQTSTPPNIHVKVKSICPQSDAEKAGLQSGDEIILVNGKTPMYRNTILDLFFNKENEPITIFIKRKDSELTTKLLPLKSCP